MEYKKLVKLDPNKSTALAKKEAASSSSEALISLFFFSSDYNRFGSLIVKLMQNILKENKKYLRTFTRAYDMLTRFELASPRRHHTERTGDRGNR